MNVLNSHKRKDGQARKLCKDVKINKNLKKRTIHSLLKNFYVYNSMVIK